MSGSPRHHVPLRQRAPDARRRQQLLEEERKLAADIDAICAQPQPAGEVAHRERLYQYSETKKRLESVRRQLAAGGAA